MTELYKKELKVAIDAAKAAGEYLRNHREKIQIKNFKEGMYNYTTTQDIESERIIVDIIRKRFPYDLIFSEESFENIGSTKRLWIIDPLDGTRNYANSLPFFSVSIAFYSKKAVQVGVVYAPCANNELFHAERNQGAYVDNMPLKMLNPKVQLSASIVTTGFAYFRGDTLKKAIKTYEKVLNNSNDVVRYGSAALEICYVAAGRIGAYYESGLKPWDVAAGSLVLEEAGGKFTNFKGGKLDLFQKDGNKFKIDTLAAKNKIISEKLLDILKS